MRTTRAARRAMEAGETSKAGQDMKTTQSDEGRSGDYEVPLVREDSDLSSFLEHGQNPNGEDSGRAVLRDITTESYPNSATPDAPTQKAGGSSSSKNNQAMGGRAVTRQGGRPAAQVEAEAVLGRSSVAEPQTKVNIKAGETSSVSQRIMAEVRGQPPCGAPAQPEDTDKTDRSPETPQKPSLVIASKTPKFDPEIHLPADTVTGGAEAGGDSFIQDIISRSPAKTSHSAGEESNPFNSCSNPELASSPRVEDSVEALDALEDALEKISEDLPALEHLQVSSPSKTSKVATKRATFAETTQQSATDQQKPVKQAKVGSKPSQPSSSVKERVRLIELSPVSKASQDTQPVRVQKYTTTAKAPPSTASSATLSTTSTAAAVSTTTKPAHQRSTSVVSAKTTRPVPATKKPKHSVSKSVNSVSTSKMSFSTSSIKDQAEIVPKRTGSGSLSTAKPGFIPSKSTKPLTKSTFSLPGDAITAKLKAQREERQKREEEEAEKKRRFKARPVPKATTSPKLNRMPRENRTSQARMSLIGKSSNENKENISPKSQPSVVIVSKTKSTEVTKSSPTSPTIATAKTVSTSNSNNPQSPPLTSNAGRNQSPSQRVASSSSTTSNTSTTSTATVQRAAITKPNGKEVFNRHRTEADILGREKKAKEEAAKKARAEAAERGREASRLWAEKRKEKEQRMAALARAGADEQQQQQPRGTTTSTTTVQGSSIIVTV